MHLASVFAVGPVMIVSLPFDLCSKGSVRVVGSVSSFGPVGSRSPVVKSAAVAPGARSARKVPAFLVPSHVGPASLVSVRLVAKSAVPYVLELASCSEFATIS